MLIALTEVRGEEKVNVYVPFWKINLIRGAFVESDIAKGINTYVILDNGTLLHVCQDPEQVRGLFHSAVGDLAWEFGKHVDLG